MPAVIGTRADVANAGGVGDRLDDYLYRVNGNNNWTVQLNLMWLSDHIARGSTFVIVSDVGELYDNAGNAARNFTVGLEIFILQAAGYRFFRRNAGWRDWEMRPGNPASRQRGIGYIQDHLMNDLNLNAGMNVYWGQHREDREVVKEKLGELWSQRFEQA